LDAEEVELLCQQVSTDTGAAGAGVEDRISKSSMFGLFSSWDGLGGGTDPMGAGPARQGLGPAPAGATTGFGAAPADGGLGEWSEFGSAAPVAGHPAVQGFGAAPEAWGTGGGDMTARSGFGAAPGPGGAALADRATDADGMPPVARLGDAPRSGFGDAGQAHGLGGSGRGEAEHLAPPKGYHNRVDADGDGRLDKATYRGHEGGGAEIRVDLNHDGQADFVGVDRDLDNRVDFADYDKDHDGVFEKRMYDDDGDGWLDRTVWH
jgi:hypothetical protein